MVDLPRVDFKLSYFQKLIQRHGYKAKIYNTLRCVCTDDNDGQPNPNCTICKGTGYVDKFKEENMVLITSVDKDKQFLIAGSWELGQAYATFLSSTLPTFMDKIELIDATINFNEIISVPDKNLSPNPYWITLKYPIVEVISLIDEAGEYYTNYQVNSEGQIYVDTDKTQKMSIKYKMHPAFRIIDFSNEFRSYYLKVKKPNPEFYTFPVRAIIKRLDLVK